MNQATISGELAPFVDSGHPGIVAFARDRAAGAGGAADVAVRLYYAVRDEVRYDPYVDLSAPDTFRASACLAAGRAFCVGKASLLTALARAAGLEARVGFADVRNHLATPRLRALMGSDIFHFHGYTEFTLDCRRVKATPAFNLSLCEKFGVLPLEFDGRADALFHPLDKAGRRHMEYLDDRGTFDDVPFDAIQATMRAAYPRLFAEYDAEGDGDFETEAEALSQA
jgi:transglutaminase-like putative cysteine protease